VARSSRPLIMSTLFDKFQAATPVTWVTATNRLKLFSDVSPAEQPYICLAEHGEEYLPTKRGMPPILKITATIVMYLRTVDGTTPLAPTLNGIMDTLDTFFMADNIDGCFTLGGLVERCWIEGKVFKDPGDLDNQGMITVPVSILVP
jgi:hypothetical protein